MTPSSARASIRSSRSFSAASPSSKAVCASGRSASAAFRATSTRSSRCGLSKDPRIAERTRVAPLTDPLEPVVPDLRSAGRGRPARSGCAVGENSPLAGSASTPTSWHATEPEQEATHADHEEHHRDRPSGRAIGSPAPSTSTALAAPSSASRLSASRVPLHARCAHRLAHPPERSDDLRARGRRARSAPRRSTSELIRPGDRVFFEPGEEHWHGAAATRFMIHLAMLEVDHEGNAATWGAHVGDEEYEAAPAYDV